MRQHFADNVITRARALGHPLCAGLDPHLDLVPPLFRRGSMRPGDPETARAVEALCRAFLERVGERVAAVKPQIAFFEQLGAAGLAALEHLVAGCRASGLPVLLDAKRGDIGSTAEAYARAYLDAGAACEVDALTLNPYLGLDTLEPFLARARSLGRGLFVLVRTSNPGAGDLQDQRVGEQPLYERLAGALSERVEELVGSETGWSSLGIVAGATWPEQAQRLRAILPRVLFLVPGYGRQGASVGQALSGFVAGPKGLEGGLVNSSRALLFPEAASAAREATTWDRVVDEAIARAVGELGEAVAAG